FFNSHFFWWSHWLGINKNLAGSKICPPSGHLSADIHYPRFMELCCSPDTVDPQLKRGRDQHGIIRQRYRIFSGAGCWWFFHFCALCFKERKNPAGNYQWRKECHLIPLVPV